MAELAAFFEKAPHLQQDINALMQAGWVVDLQGIQRTQPTAAHEVSLNRKWISVNPDQPKEAVFANLAIAVGEALSGPIATISHQGLTRQQYVAAMTREHHRSIASGLIYAFKVRNEIAAHGGPAIDLWVPPAIEARANEIAGLGGEAAAREWLVDLMAQNPDNSAVYQRAYGSRYDRLPSYEKTTEAGRAFENAEGPSGTMQ